MSEKSKRIEVDPILYSIIQNSVTVGVNEGIVRAVENIEKQRDLLQKINYDNRVRNTRLLLSNYLNFKRHINTSIYTEKQLSTEETSDILDKIGIDVDNFDKTIVESILKSKKRTEIILEHIDTILDGYMLNASKRDDLELKRRADVVEKFYREGKRLDQVSKEIHASISTTKRDKARAINEIAILMFGIDGIKFM